MSSELFEGQQTAEKVQDELIRRLDKPNRRGFANLLASSVEDVEIWSPQGSVYLGKKSAFRIDRERIGAVLRRIVRGLYFHELGYPVPETLQVVAELQPQVNPKLREILESLSFLPLKNVG